MVWYGWLEFAISTYWSLTDWQTSRLTLVLVKLLSQLKRYLIFDSVLADTNDLKISYQLWCWTVDQVIHYNEKKCMYIFPAILQGVPKKVGFTTCSKSHFFWGHLVYSPGNYTVTVTEVAFES